MTIEKGKDWGRRGVVPSEAPLATSDDEIADLFSVDQTRDKPTLVGPKLIAFAPGGRPMPTRQSSPRESTNGMAKTLGARGAPEAVLGEERTIVPVDLGVVALYRSLPAPAGIDPAPAEFVVMASSLVIANRYWSGRVEAAMNSSFLGEWNVTPSSHPNDGRFDIVSATLTLSDRLKARTRLPSGSHVPHPNISIRRLKAATFAPAANAKVWIDGRSLGHAAAIELTVVADSVELAI